jgi:serine/threonine protein kinase
MGMREDVALPLDVAGAADDMSTATSAEEAIFYEALQARDPSEREAFLRQSCAGNDALREAVERLLADHAQAEAVFRESSAALNPQGLCMETQTYTDASAGTFIGPYRLGACLGEGGGGIVYLAAQETPVRRQVALKVIKLGMDTKRVIARFEAERQALAMMEHPNIARVLDAGATETGRPYFVMELVRGERITDYCARHDVPLRERLAMFQQVCHAIQHAHQKGIIHRDIKPSNILVTLQDGAPVPKIIDFGIAKATEATLVDGTAFTANEQILGTPAYMSPEQIQGGADVDTRSDIYSLGVVLYELLAGRPPFDAGELLRRGVDEMRRVLCDVEPPRPSVAAADPQRVAALRGDLDWIVMKALEKDRERRYHTARGFAIDIEYYLRDEPVQARPPSRFYRLQKLVRRNKTAFTALGVTALALVVGFGVSTWLFVRASNAEHQQNRLRSVAEEALSREAELRRRAEEREKVARAAILISQRKPAEADAMLSERSFRLTQPSIEASQAFRAVAEWNALRGNLRRAAQCLFALVQVNRFDENDLSDNATRDLLPAAPTLIEAGDIEAYEKVRHMAISHFGHSKNAVAAEQILKISMLLPVDKELLAAAEPLARVAGDSLKGQTVPAGQMEAWRSMVLGMFEYRRGNDQAAWNWSQRCLAFSIREASRDVAAYFVQAMAAWRMKRASEARFLLQQGRRIVKQRSARPLVGRDRDGSGWFDWFDAWILQREAETLIEPGNETNAPAGR